MVIVRHDWPEAEYTLKKRDEAQRRYKENSLQKESVKKEFRVEDLFGIKVSKNMAGGVGTRASVKEVIEERTDNEDLDNDNCYVQMKTGKKSRYKPRANGIGPSYEKVGPSGHKNIKGEEINVVAAGPNPHVATGLDSVSDGLDKENVHPLAIVPYMGESLKEIVCKFNKLGLKREAEDAMESDKVKRRKLNGTDLNHKPVILAYAENLRKVKIRIRRGAKKKNKPLCDIMEEEIGGYEEVMKEAECGEKMEAGFVFKVGKGSKKRNVAEGTGGWPLTATKGK